MDRRPDGRYNPDPVQVEAFDLVMDYFDEMLKS